jgi:hypothetical protein
MADPPKSKQSTKTQRRRTPREEFCQNIIQIASWDWSYSFSLNTQRNAIDPYHEFRHLRIMGRLLRPIGQKTDKVELTLLPKADDTEDRRTDHKPLSIGSLEIYADRIVGLISIPMDALAPILTVMVGDRFKFVTMGGTKFWHRKSRLHSLGLEMNLAEEDMPPADDELS